MKYYLFEEPQMLPLGFDDAMVSYEGDGFRAVESEFENYLEKQLRSGEIEDESSFYIYDKNFFLIGTMDVKYYTKVLTSFQLANMASKEEYPND